MRLKLFCLFVFIFQVSAFSQNVDIDILRDINLGRNQHFDHLFNGITNSVLVIIPAVPVTLLCNGLIKKNSSFERNVIIIGASLLTTGSTTEILKLTINRPRPFVTFPEIQKCTKATGSSFPSGHTSMAFSLATSVSLTYPKWYVIAPSLLWAGAVGYSRMDLGVHYPSDVLVGAVLGTGSAFLCQFISRSLHHKGK